MTESFINGALLDAAYAGNRLAIQTVTKICADLLESDKATTGCQSDIIAALDSIGAGTTPNIAFGWVREDAKKPTIADKQAVMKIATLCIESLTRLRPLDEMSPPGYLHQALRKIANGIQPNQAFAWNNTTKRGNHDDNNALRNWQIKLTVQAYMKEGKLLRSASIAASDDYSLAWGTIQRICKGVTTESIIDCPTDIFPMGNQRIICTEKPKQRTGRF